MLIGQQVGTPFGGRIDLLAAASDGSLVLIELKRARTSREVVAQALDFASWVKQLEVAEIAAIYRRFRGDRDLAKDFSERFNDVRLDEEEWNQFHQIVIVAAELDDSTERITKYLSEESVSVNVLLFQVFENGDEKLLSRAWLVDPSHTQFDSAGKGKDRRIARLGTVSTTCRTGTARGRMPAGTVLSVEEEDRFIAEPQRCFLPEIRSGSIYPVRATLESGGSLRVGNRSPSSKLTWGRYVGRRSKYLRTQPCTNKEARIQTRPSTMSVLSGSTRSRSLRRGFCKSEHHLPT